MKSEPFEITVTGKYYSLHFPEHIARPFVEKNLKRVKATASFQEKQLTFHGAIQKRNDNYYIMFGKRYQASLGVFPNDYFQLQFFEDTSKYGVDIPEELDAVFLGDYEAFKIFETFTAGKKRGVIYAISRYANSQTRIDKSLLFYENIKSGIRDNRILLKSF